MAVPVKHNVLVIHMLIPTDSATWQGTTSVTFTYGVGKMKMAEGFKGELEMASQLASQFLLSHINLVSLQLA